MRLYASRMIMSTQIVHFGENETRRGKTKIKGARVQLGKGPPAHLGAIPSPN